MEGMVAIAVPLHDSENRLMSTLSIHAPVQRLGMEGLTAHLPRLKVAATDLSELMLQ